MGTVRPILFLSPLSLLLVVACGPLEGEPNSALLDKIEAQVVLPAKAASMEQYSRYYADDENGVVEAAYVMHDPAWVEDVREMCAKDKPDEFPCSNGNRTLRCQEVGNGSPW